LPTFAELLTAHIERVGISDADLSRRIGISRLTLIRWKEGVTARPRHREDVLRCAEILRLTPEELDELLLSAAGGLVLAFSALCFYAGGETFGANKRVISTTNRNFQNRQGPGVKAHLASPATVAASAVAGRIVPPS